MKYKWLAAALMVSAAFAQEDPLQEWNRQLRESTGGVLGFTFGERTRWEEKDGVNFGKSPNQQDMLSRIRPGVQIAPVDWLQINVTGQDSRAAFYGNGAPNTMRDTMDLVEGYVEFFARKKTGFGATAGRQSLNYGETRVLGSASWGNVDRPFDSARMYYRTPKNRIEILMISPVKILPDQFDKPELGERIWGTYNTFSDVWRGASFDVYALRHSQNVIGGWTGKGTLGTDSFGGRFYGKLPAQFGYSLEGIGQTGHMGLLTQRAYAWFTQLSRTVTAFHNPLNLSVEYKLASGSKISDRNSGTYDQLMSSNHDKFGDEDLFGWRNLKTFKTLGTYNFTKAFALNLMYSDEWLFSASDALYNSQGKSVAVSAKGLAGTHVGQELDSFLTYKYGVHLFGAGFGHFFKGQFVEMTTKNINPRYFYVFQQYSFR
jgi:hypothetical protein